MDILKAKSNKCFAEIAGDDGSLLRFVNS